jgi:hypothetical protein
MIYEPFFSPLPEIPENPDALVFWCVATLGSLYLLCTTIADLCLAIS